MEYNRNKFETLARGWDWLTKSRYTRRLELDVARLIEERREREKEFAELEAGARKHELMLMDIIVEQSSGRSLSGILPKDQQGTMQIPIPATRRERVRQIALDRIKKRTLEIENGDSAQQSN